MSRFPYVQSGIVTRSSGRILHGRQAPGAPVREDLLFLAAYEQVSLRRGQGFIGFEPGTSISLSCVGRKDPSDDRLLSRHPLSVRYDRLSRLNAGGDLPGSVSPEETAQGPPCGCPWSTKGARRAGRVAGAALHLPRRQGCAACRPLHLGRMLCQLLSSLGKRWTLTPTRS